MDLSKFITFHAKMFLKMCNVKFCSLKLQILQARIINLIFQIAVLDVLTNDTVVLHFRDVYNDVKLPIYIFEERKWNSLYDVYYKQLHQVKGSGSSKNANPISESFVCPLTEIKSGILF